MNTRKTMLAALMGLLLALGFSLSAVAQTPPMGNDLNDFVGPVNPFEDVGDCQDTDLGMAGTQLDTTECDDASTGQTAAVNLWNALETAEDALAMENMELEGLQEDLEEAKKAIMEADAARMAANTAIEALEDTDDTNDAAHINMGEMKTAAIARHKMAKMTAETAKTTAENSQTALEGMKDNPMTMDVDESTMGSIAMKMTDITMATTTRNNARAAKDIWTSRGPTGARLGNSADNLHSRIYAYKDAGKAKDAAEAAVTTLRTELTDSKAAITVLKNESLMDDNAMVMMHIKEGETRAQALGRLEARVDALDTPDNPMTMDVNESMGADDLIKRAVDEAMRRTGLEMAAQENMRASFGDWRRRQEQQVAAQVVAHDGLMTTTTMRETELTTVNASLGAIEALTALNDTDDDNDADHITMADMGADAAAKKAAAIARHRKVLEDAAALLMDNTAYTMAETALTAAETRLKTLDGEIALEDEKIAAANTAVMAADTAIEALEDTDDTNDAAHINMGEMKTAAIARHKMAKMTAETTKMTAETAKMGLEGQVTTEDGKVTAAYTAAETSLDGRRGELVGGIVLEDEKIAAANTAIMAADTAIEALEDTDDTNDAAHINMGEMKTAAITRHKMAKMTAETAKSTAETKKMMLEVEVTTEDGKIAVANAALQALNDGHSGNDAAHLNTGESNAMAIARIQGEKAAAETHKAALQGEIAAAQSAENAALTALQGLVTERNADVVDPNNPAAALTSELVAGTADAADLVRAISSNFNLAKEGMETNASNIATNTANITTNRNNIAVNRASINQNRSMIEGLQRDVDVLRSGIAAALATAGMPTLPNQGWGFAVGAGHFDGESAYAAGLTYNDEDRVYKVSVGSAGGETTVSAGAAWSF